jgi:GT2 family glycosyltransferase
VTDARQPIATVVVSPRDSFAHSVRCFERLLECTPTPRRIVYVDGGSPAPLARDLEARAIAADVALLRSDCVLAPNRARNLALALARAADEPAWTAFIDNDTYVEPGWLESLRACGETRNAVAVVPLLCIGEHEEQRIHVAGGVADIVDDGDGRRFEEVHPFLNQPVLPARDGMQAQRCTMFEFHGVLVRTDALHAVTPLDEGLSSLLEHVDLGFALRDRGDIWFEPSVLVTFLPGHVSDAHARRYFVTRWSDEWNRATVEHFRQKWGLAPDDAKTAQNVEFGAWMRAHAYRPYRSPFVRWSARRGRYPRSFVDRIAQRDALRWYGRQAATSGPPRLAHRPGWLEAAVDA